LTILVADIWSHVRARVGGIADFAGVREASQIARLCSSCRGGVEDVDQICSSAGFGSVADARSVAVGSRVASGCSRLRITTIAAYRMKKYD